MHLHSILHWKLQREQMLFEYLDDALDQPE